MARWAMTSIGRASAWPRRQTSPFAAGLASTRRQHRHGDARDAGQLAGLVVHFNLPDLGGSANMHRACHAGDPAAGGAFQVVGVDVQAHRAVALGAAERRTAGAQGFGQHHAHTAMQQAIRVPCEIRAISATLIYGR